MLNTPRYLRISRDRNFTLLSRTQQEILMPPITPYTQVHCKNVGMMLPQLHMLHFPFLPLHQVRHVIILNMTHGPLLFEVFRQFETFPFPVEVQAYYFILGNRPR